MTDTISAIATPKGKGALSIIRISGPQAAAIMHAIIPKAKGRHPHKMRYGDAVDAHSGHIVDEVMYCYMPGPRTSTGEDVVEIYGHGGPIVVNALLELTFTSGARLAHPGEFTARAYANGKMDLTQAEAVMAIIDAKSQKAAHIAARHLNGNIGTRLQRHYDALTHVAAELEAGLDFPDEDLPLSQMHQLATQLETLARALMHTAETYKTGSYLTQGAHVAIAGPSNAGKSSLLNQLLGTERALVHDVPGTTRDVVESQSEIDGIPVLYQDTAGLRSNAGTVEQMGIEKSHETIRHADLILLVVDGSSHTWRDASIASVLDAHTAKTLLLVNKSDAPDFDSTIATALGAASHMEISAHTGHQIDTLKNRIGVMLGGSGDEEEVILTTARQKIAVETCATHALDAARILKDGSEPELAAAEVRWSRESLASLWGHSITDDMIDEIFKSFCLGK